MMLKRLFHVYHFSLIINIAKLAGRLGLNYFDLTEDVEATN